MASKKIVQRLIVIAIFIAFLVIGLGAYTRLTNSGLGCPDWPGCYGHISAPTEAVGSYKAWTEMIHRYFAGTLALLILGIVLYGARSVHKQGHSAHYIPLFFLLLLLIYQPILGMWTVTWKLLPIVVSQHLLGGMAILALLVLCHFIFKYADLSSKSRGKTPILVFLILCGTVITYLQIALGAWTSTNYAAIVCSDFPFCQLAPWQFDFHNAFHLTSTIGPNYEGGLLSDAAKKTIQMTHRFGALVIFLYWFALASKVLFTSKNKHILSALFLVLGLLIVQLCLGISNVLLARPLLIAVSHNLIAALLLATTVRLSYLAYRFKEEMG